MSTIKIYLRQFKNDLGENPRQKNGCDHGIVLSEGIEYY
jgi:hypothetical protein